MSIGKMISSIMHLWTRERRNRKTKSRKGDRNRRERLVTL